MRMKIFIFLIFIFTVLTVSIYFISCKKDSSKTNVVQLSHVYTLTEKGMLDDQISLPKGTNWQYVKDDGSEGLCCMNKERIWV